MCKTANIASFLRFESWNGIEMFLLVSTYFVIHSNVSGFTLSLCMYESVLKFHVLWHLFALFGRVDILPSIQDLILHGFNSGQVTV
jgi:hypothetical protein